MKRLGAFLLVTLLGWNVILTILYIDVKNDTSKEVTTDTGTNKKVQEANTNITSDVTKVVEKLENKVVTITAKAGKQDIGTGSGAIYRVDNKTVYIITNHHVIAEVEDAEAFVVGNSSLVKKGEYVIAMGSPLGIEYQGSVSGGLISGTNRRMEMDIDNNGVADWDVNVLQTDAAINPGNSGGPLINMAGELIGINSMKISDTSVEGFGFALPISEVVPIISELEKNGKVVRPILGISVQPISQLTAFDKVYLDIDPELKSGILIVKVSKNSPASAAGVEVGDVLLKMDGTDVVDFKQFRQVLYSKKVGDKVSLTINRDGKIIEKSATLK